MNDVEQLAARLLTIENELHELRMMLGQQDTRPTSTSNMDLSFEDEKPANYGMPPALSNSGEDEFDAYIRQMNGQSPAGQEDNSGSFSSDMNFYSSVVQPAFNFSKKTSSREEEFNYGSSLSESLLSSLADICKEESKIDGSFDDIIGHKN